MPLSRRFEVVSSSSGEGILKSTGFEAPIYTLPSDPASLAFFGFLVISFFSCLLFSNSARLFGSHFSFFLSFFLSSLLLFPLLTFPFSSSFSSLLLTSALYPSFWPTSDLFLFRILGYYNADLALILHSQPCLGRTQPDLGSKFRKEM